MPPGDRRGRMCRPGSGSSGPVSTFPAPALRPGRDLWAGRGQRERTWKKRSTGPTFFWRLNITSYDGTTTVTSDDPLNEEEKTHGKPGGTAEGVPGTEAGGGNEGPALLHDRRAGPGAPGFLGNKQAPGPEKESGSPSSGSRTRTAWRRSGRDWPEPKNAIGQRTGGS